LATEKIPGTAGGAQAEQERIAARNREAAGWPADVKSDRYIAVASDRAVYGTKSTGWWRPWLPLHPVIEGGGRIDATPTAAELSAIAHELFPQGGMPNVINLGAAIRAEAARRFARPATTAAMEAALDQLRPFRRRGGRPRKQEKPLIPFFGIKVFNVSGSE
jgi:hypothetical protein